ncbi:MAG: hypothetical protein K9W43_05115 [Candidatus Thorarchaeota archaeon]|nr:hypothetical protein [Candidatus Thorarchaeota archaeon]
MGDDDFIKEEFEWALQDPTEEKLRSLGEVVSTITKKLVEAISELQVQVYEVQKQMQTLDSRIDTLQNKIANLRTAPATAASGGSTPSAGAAAPVAAAATPKPPPPKAPSGPTTMMGELKMLLAARRQKATEE